MTDELDRSLLPQVLDDLRALGEEDEALVDAAMQGIVDIARRRKVGKLLGARDATGDLTGARRVKFDLEGERPQRFRIVYRLLPDDESADTVEVLAVGHRGGHTVYAAVVERLG